MDHTLLMAVQPTSDLEPEEPRKKYEEIGRVTAIILVHKLSKLARPGSAWSTQTDFLVHLSGISLFTVLKVCGLNCDM